jgi:hypothetical protein
MAFGVARKKYAFPECTGFPQKRLGEKEIKWQSGGS